MSLTKAQTFAPFGRSHFLTLVYTSPVFLYRRLCGGCPRSTSVCMQTRYMTDEVFPGKLFVEAKGRTEKDSLMNSVGTALVELAARLKP